MPLTPAGLAANRFGIDVSLGAVGADEAEPGR